MHLPRGSASNLPLLPSGGAPACRACAGRVRATPSLSLLQDTRSCDPSSAVVARSLGDACKVTSYLLSPGSEGSSGSNHFIERNSQGKVIHRKAILLTPQELRGHEACRQEHKASEPGLDPRDRARPREELRLYPRKPWQRRWWRLALCPGIAEGPSGEHHRTTSLPASWGSDLWGHGMCRPGTTRRFLEGHRRADSSQDPKRAPAAAVTQPLPCRACAAPGEGGPRVRLILKVSASPVCGMGSRAGPWGEHMGMGVASVPHDFRHPETS